ncbi:MAG TPA: NAD+ synthase [Bryobacterales bacterium]|jgi:NAD+ synthase (glutamine-hydrolysing)|nr:NAD+ synthase [Bryobacterales bacterium]
MKIALGQINPTVGDLAGNVDLIIRFAREAANRGADLAVFPELSISGYPPRDLVEKASFLAAVELELERLARETGALGIDVICGFPRRNTSSTGKTAANCLAYLSGGEVRFTQQKMLLPTYDVFDESRNFAPGEQEKVFPAFGRRLALTICEDVWNDKQFWERQLYASDPVDELVAQGADFLINISGSPYHMHKRPLRREMLAAIARRRKMPVVFVNQVGGNDQLVFDGTSFVLDASGEVRAAAKSFQEDLVLYDAAANAGEMHENFCDELEAVYEALVVGCRDYVRKCGFQTVLIGLSGGIDSSLTAVVAADAVGRQNVTGVSMPGPYSSPGSIADARSLAEKLGIRLEVVDITKIYEVFRDALAPVFAGRPADVTEENLQARIRGATLMALSNKFGSLVLTTGNKSELAVGYCTLYGDMCGGLAVISDVPKTLVYELARVANRRHEGAIPKAVFQKPPSAELRPNQKDSDSIPEYDVLDPILKAYIEENESPECIARRLRRPLELVRKIVRMVDANEYKRQQAAPGIRVTSKAFGMGRRFPIAQAFRE